MKRKALILTWSRFQDHEVIYPYYALKEHNFEVDVAGDVPIGSRMIGDLGSHIVCNICLINECPDPNDYNLLVIPGGVKALEKLRLNKFAVLVVKHFFEHNKMVFCICNGAQLLITADVLRGRKCAGYYSIEPDIINAGAEYTREVCIDKNLITCSHYDQMGEWLKEGFINYEIYNVQKALGKRGIGLSK